MNKTQGGILVLVGVVVACAVVIPLVILLPSQKGELVVAKASEGSIVGVVTTEAGIFWGVPFSQSPSGDFRWRRPRDPVPYNEPYWNATYKRPGCQQICDELVPEYTCPTEFSEDCLYLNIFVPKRLLKGTEAKDPLNENHYEIDPSYLPGGDKTSLPVMIWFHGGNFKKGSGSGILYDGRFLAYKGDVIVVTTNYRLAHLGFLVQGTEGEDAKGNFGFWDQVKAMEWVNKNIAMFGGNPNQVTLFGQSAGAESIGIHLTSHVSDHLFQQAIMESNPFGLPFRTMEDAKSFGDRFAVEAGCSPDDMTCLRSKSVDELEDAFKNTQLLDDASLITLFFQPWSPVIDGDVVPGQPVRMFDEKRAQPKPIIAGATIEEATIYVAGVFPRPVNTTTYKLLCLAVFKNDYEAVIKMYPPVCEESKSDCDNRELLSKLATEYLFECPQRRAINSTSNQSWLYSFNQTWSFYEAWDEPQCNNKVCHGAEMAYIFGVESLTYFTYTKQERELSEKMIRYWTNFAHNKDPNDYLSIDLTLWSMYDWVLEENQYQYEALEMKASGDGMLLNPYNEFCNFWDSLDVYAEHYR